MQLVPLHDGTEITRCRLVTVTVTVVCGIQQGYNQQKKCGILNMMSHYIQILLLEMRAALAVIGQIRPPKQKSNAAPPP